MMTSEQTAAIRHAAAILGVATIAIAAALDDLTWLREQGIPFPLLVDLTDMAKINLETLELVGLALDELKQQEPQP